MGSRTMKNYNVLFTVIAMIAMQSPAISQLKLHSFRAAAGQEYGLSKTTWSTKIGNGYRNYQNQPQYEASHVGIEAAVDMHRGQITAGYNFQKSRLFTEEFSMNEEIYEHQYTIGFMSEQMTSIPGISVFLGLKAGLNKINARRLHPSLLNFSTPADIGVTYLGVISEMELGAQYQFANTPYFIAAVPNISYAYSEVFRVNTRPDDGEYSATGKLRNITMGLKFAVGVRFVDIQKE
jgi:hypothetical protein